MGRYSNEKYNVLPLSFNASFKQKNSETKKHLNTIHNQITFTIQKLNLIVERRVKAVNEYRKLDLEHDNLLHEKTFEGKDTKKQEEELTKRRSPVLRSITIDTEIYFLYAKILLDSISSLIFYYEDNLPLKSEHNFSVLYYHIIENGCKNFRIQHVFQNNLKWYPLMIQIPRNNLLVHDTTTAGLSWNDHGIDISIGKSSWEYKSEEKLKQILQIVENHKDHFQLNNHGGYIHPILMELIRKPEVFDHGEIKTINDISKDFSVFPYMVEVQPKIQEFLTFIQNMIQPFDVEGYW